MPKWYFKKSCLSIKLLKNGRFYYAEGKPLEGFGAAGVDLKP